jgi:hypothetical protein
MFVSAPRLKLTLLENAYGFLVEGVERFGKVEPLGGEANRTDMKSALVNVAQSVELFLKARLSKEHPLLVFSDPGKASPTAQTVGVLEALRRLRCSGVQFSHRDADDMIALHDFRNRVLHFEIDVLEEDVTHCIGRAVSFLDRFLPSQLSDSLDGHLSPHALFIARKAGLEYDDQLKLAKHQLAEGLASLSPEERERTRRLECDFCGHELILYPSWGTVPPNRVRCYFCDQSHLFEPCRRCGNLRSDQLCDFCSRDDL